MSFYLAPRATRSTAHRQRSAADEQQSRGIGNLSCTDCSRMGPREPQSHPHLAIGCLHRMVSQECRLIWAVAASHAKLRCRSRGLYPKTRLKKVHVDPMKCCSFACRGLPDPASTCYGASGTIQDGACGMGIGRACFRRACAAGTTENRPVVALLGLSFEARIAGGVTVINHGAQTPAMLRSAVLRGSRGIISFGLCGGLDPSLRPGQWIIASSVVFGDEIYQPDKRWSERLIATIPGARSAMVAGVDSAITDFRERLRLHARTGAVVADMESHVAARIAAEHELPFVACRVVINPAHRKLTSAALLRLRPGGAPDLRGIFRSVLARPSQLLHLMRLAVDASIALSVLRQGRLLLGNQLGFPDSAEEEPALVNSQMLTSLVRAENS